MDIRADLELPFPRERVWLSYRDRLDELREWLPNIKRITQRERSARDGVTHIVNEWLGGGDIPKAAQAVVSESMLRWTEHATWTDASFSVVYWTEIHAFPEAVRCTGENRFIAIEGGMRLEMRGDITCDASKINGVPRFFAKTVAGIAEKMLVGSIQPNLLEVGRAVGKLLEREAAHE